MTRQHPAITPLKARIDFGVYHNSLRASHLKTGAGFLDFRA
jgi:hypothetical protein